MQDRLFGLDPQLILDTCITLVAMLALFILLSYLLFNPARQMIEKRKKFIQDQLISRPGRCTSASACGRGP